MSKNSNINRDFKKEFNPKNYNTASQISSHLKINDLQRQLIVAPDNSFSINLCQTVGGIEPFIYLDDEEQRHNFKTRRVVVTTMGVLRQGIKVVDFDEIICFKLNKQYLGELHSLIARQVANLENGRCTNLKKVHLSITEQIKKRFPEVSSHSHTVSPIKLKVLLHYYCCPGPFCKSNPESPASTDAIDFWVNRDMLEEDFDRTLEEDPDLDYAITEKGKVYVEAVLNTPFPIKTWIVPTITKE
jgi:hypothetical protein